MVVKEAIERIRTLNRFAHASARWIAAGRPTRSQEQIAQLLEVCKACPNYKQLKPDFGRCKLCGCRLNLGHTLNKLLWATEQCPDEPPRWGPAVEPPELTDQQVREIDHKRQQEEVEARRKKAEMNAAQVTNEAPASRPAPQPPAAPGKPMTRQERREARAKRVAERAERIRKRQAAEAALPPLQTLPANDDQLHITDREGHPIGHVLRNIWAPAAGFLVCGGPSLKDIDLSHLRERGIVSLAVNNVAGMAPVDAFVCGDPPEKFHFGIFTDPAMIKFVPIRRLGQRVRAKLKDGTFAYTSMRVKDCPNVYGFKRDSHWEPEAFFAREWATWGCGKDQAQKENRPHILFSFFLGLRFMHYLGCRRVYLLGVDFAMDGERGYAFPQGRTPGAIRGNNNSYRIATGMCDELKPIFEKEGYELFNCNRRSHLTAWPYVPFEEALEDCRGIVPKEPFDLTQWYEKPGDEDDKRTDEADG